MTPRFPAHRYEARARIARALANPSRQVILEALAQRECCVCELTTLIGADQSTISKHLAVLKGVGIVGDRRDGQKTFYHLKTPCVQDIWTCIEAALRQNLAAEQEALDA
jgi:ArsR family transcriptional regulator